MLVVGEDGVVELVHGSLVAEDDWIMVWKMVDISCGKNHCPDGYGRSAEDSGYLKKKIIEK